MTEQSSPVPPSPPMHPAAYMPYGWQSPRQTHAEMTWQDLMACITAFFGASIIALVLGWHSHDMAKKQGLKMHAAGMVGLIFGALGTAGWTLFFLLMWIGIAASAAKGT